jgi:hypothetical protein
MDKVSALMLPHPSTALAFLDLEDATVILDQHQLARLAMNQYLPSQLPSKRMPLLIIRDTISMCLWKHLFKRPRSPTLPLEIHPMSILTVPKLWSILEAHLKLIPTAPSL